MYELGSNKKVKKLGELSQDLRLKYLNLSSLCHKIAVYLDNLFHFSAYQMWNSSSSRAVDEMFEASSIYKEKWFI